ncbi:hypothetical protein ACFPOI_31215 [Nonomuraea angiospora]|uniref:Uncharacterized protein n=1 Tax=Nonomuraea angiospora TaxID=46172 RepID=A0ABR9M5B0_9ACTN|nr:hypothetical protein [Nonomuraea angiospora]MBE1587486.1 hypothetical protein [Nonomuraea angiospora]
MWPALLLGRQVAVTMMGEGRGLSDVKGKRERGRRLRGPSWWRSFKEELA